jgi:hypothetical protein
MQSMSIPATFTSIRTLGVHVDGIIQAFDVQLEQQKLPLPACAKRCTSTART